MTTTDPIHPSTTATVPAVRRSARRGVPEPQTAVADAPWLGSETPLVVRFADVDSMRVAHHTTYLHWFEQIRFHFLETLLGVDYAVLEDEGIGVPLVTCAVRYHRPVLFGDRPVGYARIEPSAKAMLTFHYHLFHRRGGQLCATGTTTHCYLGRDQRLLLWTPPVLDRAFAHLVERHPDCVVGAAERKGTSDA